MTAKKTPAKKTPAKRAPKKLPLNCRHSSELEAARLDPGRFVAESRFFTDLILAEEEFLIRLGWKLVRVEGKFTLWEQMPYTNRGKANIFCGHLAKPLPMTRNHAVLVTKADYPSLGAF